VGTGSERFEAHLIAYQVEFKPSAKKALGTLPKKVQRRIQGVIHTLGSNPLPPVAVKLVGRDGYRIRVSDYRIVYTIHKNVLTVVIVSIGHRREVYRKN